MPHKDGFKPIISIVVPVYNQSELTVRCFSSIRKYTTIPYEIVWVDNGSSVDQFKLILRQAKKPNVHTKLVKNLRNLGFVKATNQGIKEAEGDYVILLNNDTEVGYRWDQALIKPFVTEEKIGVVGPVTNSRISWQEATNLNLRWNLNLPRYQDGVEAYSRKLYESNKDKYIDVGKIPLAFFCAAFQRKTFSDLGFLDEDFGMGLGEDDHYCSVLRTAGFKVMLSLGSFVFHKHRTTFKATRMDVDSMHRRAFKLLKEKKKALSELSS